MSTMKYLKSAGVGTVATVLTDTGINTGASTPAANIVWNIPRMYFTNITSGIVKVTVTHISTSSSTRLAFTRPVAIGDALVLEHIVMKAGDTLSVVADTVTGIDIYGSVDEEAA